MAAADSIAKALDELDRAECLADELEKQLGKVAELETEHAGIFAIAQSRLEEDGLSITQANRQAALDTRVRKSTEALAKAKARAERIRKGFQVCTTRARVLAGAKEVANDGD